MLFDYDGIDAQTGYHKFKTPKPLSFIVQKDGWWWVYTLYVSAYVNRKINVYFGYRYRSYQKARQNHLVQLQYFNNDRGTFKDWPIK